MKLSKAHKKEKKKRLEHEQNIQNTTVKKCNTLAIIFHKH